MGLGRRRGSSATSSLGEGFGLGAVGPTPIFDPDLPEDQQPDLRGLALPDVVLQKIYHDNPVRFLAKVGMTVGGWG